MYMYALKLESNLKNVAPTFFRIFIPRNYFTEDGKIHLIGNFTAPLKVPTDNFSDNFHINAEGSWQVLKDHWYKLKAVSIIAPVLILFLHVHLQSTI